MIDQNLQPHSLHIDTAEIWHAISDNVKMIDSQLIWNYKHNLEASFRENENLKPEAPYSWKNWRYYKGKYDSIDENYRSESPCLIQYTVKHIRVSDIIPELSRKHNIPEDNFKQRDYCRLKDSDKVEFILGTALNNFDYIHPYPKDKKAISEEFKEDVITFFNDIISYEKVSSGDYSIVFERRDYPDPTIWLEVGYDVYHLSQKQHLVWDDNDDFFLESLLWFLVFLDPKYFKKEYLNYLCSNNNKSLSWLFSTIKLLKLKYTQLYMIVDLKEKLDLIDTSDFNNNIEKLPMKKTEDEGSNKKKVGRPANEYRISKPISRSLNDKKTSISCEDTKILFHYLLKAGIILNQDHGLTKNNRSKLIACLTGYNESELKKAPDLNNEKKMRAISKKLDEITMLINRDLQKK